MSLIRNPFPTTGVLNDTLGGQLEHLITASLAYKIRDLRFPWREIPMADALARPGFVKWLTWAVGGEMYHVGTPTFIGYGHQGQQYAYNPSTHEVALGDVTFYDVGWRGDMTG